MKFELVFSSLFLLLILFFWVKSLFQVKSWNGLNIFIQIYFLSFLGQFGLAVSLYLDYAGLLVYYNYSKAFLLMGGSVYLGMIYLLKCEEILPKYIKTLFRLPLIGFLGGLYLSSKWTYLVLFIFVMLALGIVLGEKERLRYLIRKMRLSVLISFCFLIFCIKNEMNELNILIFSALFFLSSISITILLRVKDILRSES